MQQISFQKLKISVFILSPLCLSLAWYLPWAFLLLFIGFVPLILLEKRIREQNLRFPKVAFFGYVYMCLLIWNTATTWWVWNSSVGGAIGMLLTNTFLMSLPWILFSQTRKMFGEKIGIGSLVLYWLAFEYGHLHWDLSWTWLNLGNGFAYTPACVQWYEYTGTLGGTLWVLVANVLVYYFWQYGFNEQRKLGLALLLLLPLLLSLILYISHQEQGEQVEIVVVQPNIDPYTEKFVGTQNFISYDKQADILLKLAQSKISPKTALLMFPETAFDEGYEEKSIATHLPIQKIINLVSSTPQDLAILGGATSWIIYGNEKRSVTARQNKQIGFYDVFNTAFFIRKAVDSVAFYHKSQLVPLVESMPYPEIIEKILGNVIIDLGGTSGGVGKQAEREVFYLKNTAIAPIICYESVYGEYVGEYVRKGANILCIITNDGWWGNTAGHRQHWQLARLRAIETRRAVARSANTGISGFISQRGDELEKTIYWTQDARIRSIQAGTKLTFYVIYGDFLGKTAGYASIMLLIILCFQSLLQGRIRNQKKFLQNRF